MAKKKEVAFEESLAKLEEIVKTLEQGDSTLEELMQNYSTGVELAKSCLDALNKAEAVMDLQIGEEGGKVTEQGHIIENT